MSKNRQKDEVMNQQRDCLRSNKQLNQPTKKQQQINEPIK